MNIKELANRYRNEIPNNLTEIEFLKAVYIKLGKERIFDEKYYFGNSGTMKKIYQLAKKERNNTETNYEKRTIICYSLSYEIKHIVKEFGYKCEVTPSFETGEHVFPIITLSDGTRIKYDLQKDLENIQFHCQTEYFATKDEDDYGYNLYAIEEDKQFEIDKSIGYVSTKKDYRNSDIEKLDEKIDSNTSLTIWEKLKVILTDNSVNEIASYSGYIETFRFYSKRLLPRFFDKKELHSKVHIITCSKTKINDKDENEKELTNLIYIDDKSAPKSVYIFSRVHNKYILAPYENIIKLESEGLNIGNDFFSNGSKKFKKELKKYKKSLLETNIFPSSEDDTYPGH